MNASGAKSFLFFLSDEYRLMAAHNGNCRRRVLTLEYCTEPDSLAVAISKRLTHGERHSEWQNTWQIQKLGAVHKWRNGPAVKRRLLSCVAINRARCKVLSRPVRLKNVFDSRRCCFYPEVKWQCEASCALVYVAGRSEVDSGVLIKGDRRTKNWLGEGWTSKLTVKPDSKETSINLLMTRWLTLLNGELVHSEVPAGHLHF